MSWRHFADVLKTSRQDVLKMSWRSFEDVFKTFWRCLQDVLETFLQDVLKTPWKRLEDVWPRRIYIGLYQDVFWRRKAEASIFVLIKTSSEGEGKRRLQDFFIKTNVCWLTFCKLGIPNLENQTKFREEKKYNTMQPSTGVLKKVFTRTHLQ